MRGADAREVQCNSVRLGAVITVKIQHYIHLMCPISCSIIKSFKYLDNKTDRPRQELKSVRKADTIHFNL